MSYGAAVNLLTEAQKTAVRAFPIQEVKMINQSQLKNHLSYNPETGIFTWLVPTGKRVRAGDRAGSLSSDGYVRIFIDKTPYRAHRLVWLYMYDEFPKDQIDHINLDRTDNRLSNLREATHQQNQWNRSKRLDTSSRFIGVSKDKQHKKYRVTIKLNNKTQHIGYYTSEYEASQAYLEAKQELHAF